MSYELVILERAHSELAEAYDFYALVSDQILRDFDMEVEQVYSYLEKNPHFQLRHKDFRVIPVKRFPFVLFYKIDEDEKRVYIYSVFHTSQHPKKYPKR